MTNLIKAAAESDTVIALNRLMMPVMFAVMAWLGTQVRGDVKSTLQTVRAIEIQQVRDGKDIETHERRISALEYRLSPAP